MENTERIKESLADILEWAKEGAETGAGFIAEQAPLVCQEIVMLGRVHNTVLFVGYAILVAVSVYLGSRAFEAGFKADWYRGDEYVAATILQGIPAIATGLVGSICAFNDLRELCLAWFAPRLYVIEYISDLVK